MGLALPVWLLDASREARLRMGRARGTRPRGGVEAVAWGGRNWRGVKCIFSEMLPLQTILKVISLNWRLPGVVEPCTNGDRVSGVVDALLPLAASLVAETTWKDGEEEEKEESCHAASH